MSVEPPSLHPDAVDRGRRARSALAGGRFADVRWLASTGSTNADVLELVRAGEPEGIVVVATGPLTSDPLAEDDPRLALNDPRYARLRPEDLPRTECLRDTVARVVPFWTESIAPSVRLGRRIIVAAHGNSLRALIMVLEKLSPEQIIQRELATGAPVIYRLNADSTVASKLDLAG